MRKSFPDTFRGWKWNIGVKWLSDPPLNDLSDFLFNSLSDESNSRYIISTHSFITFKDICGKDLIIMVVHWEKFIFFHSFLKQILFIIMIVLRQISWSMFIFRSSYLEVFFEKGVPKICSKFTGEYLWRSVISIKLLCNFI